MALNDLKGVEFSVLLRPTAVIPKYVNNEVKYFRINPVNDKTIGLDNIKIIRHRYRLGSPHKT